MKQVQIRWQRLVDDTGKTCDRCGTTEAAIEQAVSKLIPALAGLGIEVVLEKEALAPAQFLEDTLQSNRIYIAGEPFERWLSATSGQSKCCSACGESDCRTLTIDGRTYEAIPEELIMKAVLLAAGYLLQPDDENDKGCCSADCDCR